MKHVISFVVFAIIVGLSAQAFGQSQMMSFDKRNPSGKYAAIQLAQPFDVPTKQCWGNQVFPENVVSAKWQRLYDQGKATGWQRQVVFRNLTFASADSMLDSAPGLREAIESHLDEIASKEAGLPSDPAADVILQETWRVSTGGAWEILPRNFAKK